MICNRFAGALIALLLILFPWSAKAQGISPCGTAQTISASSSSSNIQLGNCSGYVLLWNIGTIEAFYNYGTPSTTVATTSNWSIPPASYILLNLGTNRPYLAGITASSTTTLRITQGFLR